MKDVILICFGAVLVLEAAMCPPSPNPPPPPLPADAAPGDMCQAACDALDRAKCGLGGTSCPSFMAEMQNSQQHPNPAAGGRPMTCADVAAVVSKADAQALGFSCP